MQVVSAHALILYKYTSTGVLYLFKKRHKNLEEFCTQSEGRIEVVYNKTESWNVLRTGNYNFSLSYKQTKVPK